MEFNWLLLAGYIYRTADKYFNKDFPFAWNNPEGRKNLKTSIFNGLIIGLVFYLSYYVYLTNEYPVWKYMIAYFVIGWFIDSFFAKVITMASKIYDKILAVWDKSTDLKQ